MGKHVVRAIKIAIICVAAIIGVAAVLKSMAIGWWCVALLVLTCAYWPIGPHDPWLSAKSLRDISHRMEAVQASRPDWVAPKQSISSAGLMYFGTALLLLSASQLDFSTGRDGVLKSLAQVTGSATIQLLLVLIGTCMLFWSYETMQAIRRHITPTGQIQTDDHR